MARFALILSILAVFAAPRSRAQSFEGLGFLDASDPLSYANGVSADGSVVVGYSYVVTGVGTTTGGAYRWEGSMQALPYTYPQFPYGNWAHGISADGTVTVGWSAGAIVGQQRAATRWVGSAPQDVGPPVYSEAYATSADGSVVVGQVSTRTLRWANGSPQIIEIGSQSAAHDVSADGSVMVGYAFAPFGQAYRWENNLVEFLSGFPNDDPSTAANGITPDGTIIVGESPLNGVPHMARWVDGVIEDLGPGVALSVSADGNVVVGHDADPTDRRAQIWTPEGGVQDLRTFLVDTHGLDLTGWTLTVANAVSDDGTTIVGNGVNPAGDQEGWRAVLEAEPFAVTAPAEDEIVPPGEPYTVRFDAPPDADAVDLYLVTTLNPNGPRTLLAEGVPAVPGTYSWDVPEDLLSPSTFLIAVNADDASREAVSERFRVRDPWYLHRVVGTLLEPEYEPLSFEDHVWSFDQSDENVWPEAYWDRLYHYYGDTGIGYDPFVEPVPDVVYDQSYFRDHTASDHPAWPAFVRAFGVEGTYASLEPWTFHGSSRHQPNPQAASEWHYLTFPDREYNGICYGLAVGMLAAFQDPERFDAAWLPSGGSENLASVPLTDEVRDAGHTLYVYQWGRLQQNERYFNEAVEPVVSPRDVIERLKDLFERDDRDRDRTLLFCSEVDQDGDGEPDEDGCHAVTPFGMSRVDGPDGLYSVGVYDPNLGNLGNATVFVDSTANAWTYSDPYWFGQMGKGLTLTIPVIYAFEPASTLWPHVFEDNAAGPPLAARGGTPDVRRVRITGTAGAVTSGAGELRYEDGVLTETLPGGFVSFPITGRASQPDAYVAPAGDAYRAEAVPDSNGAAAIRAEGGPVSAGLVQTGTAGNTRTVVDLLDAGLAVRGGGAGVFALSAAVVSADSTEIRTINADSLAASNPTGLRLTAGAGAETFRLAGAQASGSYTLRVRAAAAGAYRAFVHADVPLGAGAVHTLYPSWDDLSTVIVEVDADGDGDTDETLVLENEGMPTANEPGRPDTLPLTFALHPAFPNPFNPSTVFRLDVPVAGLVEVAVFDMLGRRVTTLVDGDMDAGSHALRFDAGELPSGVYIVRAIGVGGQQTRSVTLLR